MPPVNRRRFLQQSARAAPFAAFALHAGARALDEPPTVIVGAGQDFGNGGDDFSWMEAWHVEDRGTAHGNWPQAMPGREPILAHTVTPAGRLWFHDSGTVTLFVFPLFP